MLQYCPLKHLYVALLTQHMVSAYLILYTTDVKTHDAITSHIYTYKAHLTHVRYM